MSNNVIGIIPARGGSKGIKNKNLVLLNGKPLIWYTISEAMKSHCINKLILSSEDSKIIETAAHCGLHSGYVRPESLAQDGSLIRDVVLDALDWVIREQGDKPTIGVLLQPTSPLRTVEHIDEALNLFIRKKLTTLVAVNKMIEHPCDCISCFNDNPMTWKYLTTKIGNNRQDYGGNYFFISGALYIFDVEWFLEHKSFIEEGKTYLYEMPWECSIDIDHPRDFYVADMWMKRRQKDQELAELLLSGDCAQVKHHKDEFQIV